MPRIAYVPKRFSKAHLEVIAHASAIAQDYATQGYDLTLRQVYYRFVAGGLIPNRQAEYKRLGSILNDARLAGLLDWDYITDRTRNLRSAPRWDDPEAMVTAAAGQYAIDLWADQDYRVEVWVEKDALVGIVGAAAGGLQVPYFSCRGYTSQSEVWGAAVRLMGHAKAGQEPIIVHLGDHDPSGLDMSRDIRERLALFMEHHGYQAPTVTRVALNWDQVEAYEPPPNPVKLTDSRSPAYQEAWGDESWELDALEPSVLRDLIVQEVDRYRDQERYDALEARQEEERQDLQRVARHWSVVMEHLDAEGLA